MIKCPKCEADNQIGAIFCRGCGEKLDLDEIKPETVKASAKKVRGTDINWFKWIKNIILLGVLAFLVIVFWRLFQTPVNFEPYELSDKDLKTAEGKLESFKQGNKTTFTQDHINALAIKTFGLGEDAMEKYLEQKSEDGEEGMVTRTVDVELLDDNRIRITMYQKHNTKDMFMFKYYSAIEGKVSVGDHGLEFKPDGYWMGTNPFGMADFLKKKIVDRFVQLRSGNTINNDLDDVIAKTAEITIKDGSVTIRKKGTPKKKDKPTSGTKKKRRGRR